MIFKEKGINLCKKRGASPKKNGGREGYVKKKKKKGGRGVYENKVFYSKFTLLSAYIH